MRRAELLAELDRLGSRPVPLPDPRRVDEFEQRIYRDFVVTPPPSGRTNVLTIRRRRRQVLVAGLGLAAAASAAAMIMNRDVSHGFELQAATGAVALFPDGESRAVHSGDEIPAGGLIQTGPAGAVTIEGTTIGSDQVVLVSEAGLTLLPAPATPPEVQVEPPATPAPSSAPATAPPPASPPPAETPIAAPAGDQPVAPVAYSVPLGALALTVGEDTGGVNLAWTPSDAEAFDRYVVVRGTTTTRQLEEIAALADRQITSFTDPAAPHDVALLYQVVALDSDGRPLSSSEVVELTLQGDGSAGTVPGSDIPPTSDPSGGADTIPSTSEPTPSEPPSTTTEPPATTDAPATTTTGTATTTSEPVPSTEPTTAPTTSGEPSTTEEPTTTDDG